MFTSCMQLEIILYKLVTENLEYLRYYIYHYMFICLYYHIYYIVPLQNTIVYKLLHKRNILLDVKRSMFIGQVFCLLTFWWKFVLQTWNSTNVLLFFLMPFSESINSVLIDGMSFFEVAMATFDPFRIPKIQISCRCTSKSETENVLAVSRCKPKYANL